MRKWVLIFFLSLLGVLQAASLFAQSKSKVSLHYFDQYLQVTAKREALTKEFIRFSENLGRKKDDMDDVHFLKSVFSRTHQRYLRTYIGDANFNQLVEKGEYNCLTATALYALLLEDMEYDYKVIETNYHIFLVVHTASGKILFETTGPEKGFMANESEIEKRLARYKENRPAEAQDDKNYYMYSFKLYHEVSLDQMLGLLHYNESIKSFNAQQLPTAIMYLDKAIRLYNSPRIEEFSKIILISVMKSKLETSIKENCVRKIQSIRKQKVAAIANSVISDNP